MDNKLETLSVIVLVLCSIFPPLHFIILNKVDDPLSAPEQPNKCLTSTADKNVEYNSTCTKHPFAGWNNRQKPLRRVKTVWAALAAKWAWIPLSGMLSLQFHAFIFQVNCWRVTDEMAPNECTLWRIERQITNYIQSSHFQRFNASSVRLVLPTEAPQRAASVCWRAGGCVWHLRHTPRWLPHSGGVFFQIQ